MKQEQKDTIQEALFILGQNRENCVFHTDVKTRACVCVWNGAYRSGIGVSVCNPADRWIKPIGLAIAMYRAKGRKVPEKFLHFDAGCEVSHLPFPKSKSEAKRYEMQEVAYRITDKGKEALEQKYPLRNEIFTQE